MNERQLTNREAIDDLKFRLKRVQAEKARLEDELSRINGEEKSILKQLGQFSDEAYEEGAALDLLDFTDCTPNWNKLIEQYPSIAEDLTTDEGHILNFPNITWPLEKSSDTGLVIRQDWLDDLGLEAPVTYDEYHDVLTEFKLAYNISDPYVMPYNVLSPWGMMAGGYGLTLTDGATNFYMEEDQIALATISDAYYDWLSMFRQWFVEGLISSDFMSQTTNLPDDALITNSQAGIWFSDRMYLKTYSELLSAVDPSFKLGLCPDPGMDRDYSGYIGKDDTISVSNGGFSVSENCDEPEIAMAWCDYWYDESLRQFINYGFEGVTFEYDENGQPQLGGLITNNEYGLTTRLASGLYLCTSGGFMNMSVKFENDYTDLQKAAPTLWDVETKDESTIHTYGLPSGFSLNAEESSEMTAIMTDIVTYVTEYALRFVTGATELTPESYATYVQNVKSMRYDQVMDIMNGAYERYLASN